MSDFTYRGEHYIPARKEIDPIGNDIDLPPVSICRSAALKVTERFAGRDARELLEALGVTGALS